MKKFARRCAVGFGILLIFLGLLGVATFTAVDSRPYRELPARTAATTALEALRRQTNVVFGELRAGFARMKLTPTLGVTNGRPELGEFASLPLAGYGNRQGRPAEGARDDLWVKALAFAVGGRTGVVVCADALIIPREVAELALTNLAQVAGLTRGQVYFSATHTHGGPGGWGEGFVGEAFAGPFDPDVRTWFAGQLVAATVRALNDLAPAQLGADAFAAPQFIRNRLVGDQGTVDPEFAFTVVRQTDGDQAVLGCYGAHATVLGAGEMRFHGDYPGAWQRAVEERAGGLAVFAAGGVGSHGHRAPAGGHEGAEQMGRALADEMMARLPQLVLTNRIAFGLAGVELPLPPLQVRIAEGVRLRPWVARELLPVADRTWLQGLRLGDTIWLSTPCDFSGELALELKAQARALRRRCEVTSFNGDYVGYVVPTRYQNLDSYESRTMSFFGPQLTDGFMETLGGLLETLR